MADLETAPPVKFRYWRLKYSEEFESEGGEQRRMRLGGRRSRRWFRIGRASRLKKLIKIPSLTKLLRLKKSRLVTAMRGSISKVLKRFRDGEPYLGDLFAGNYLFVHVNPSSNKCLKNQTLCPSKFRPALFPPALTS